MITIKFVLNNLDSYRARFWISSILGILDGIVSFAIPIILSEFTKYDLTKDNVNKLIFYLTLCFLASIILQWFIRKSGESLAYEFANYLRQKYFKRIEALKTSELINKHSGYILSLVDKVSDGTTKVIFDIIWPLTHSIAILTLFFIFTAKESYLIALINLTVLIVFLVISVFLSKQMVPIADKLNLLRASLIETFVDLMTNIFTVKKLGIHNYANSKLENKVLSNNSQIQKLQSFHATRWLFLHLIFGIAFIGTIAFLLHQISNGVLKASILILFISAFSRIRNYIEQLSEMIKDLLQINAYVSTLENTLSNKEIDFNESVPSLEEIKLENVIFSYDKSNIEIAIPDFKLKKGDIISIVGESGQGKSTFIDILSGFLDVNTGDFTFNNKLISKNLNYKSLFSISAQEIDLFNISIKENLTLGEDIRDIEVIDILKNLNLYQWYKELPDGLNTKVGEKGVKLSAGQKQRLSIARAIILDREILILDEPTSHLDEDTEDKVIKFIKNNLRGKSAVFVTHKDKIKTLCNKHYKFRDNVLLKV